MLRRFFVLNAILALCLTWLASLSHAIDPERIPVEELKSLMDQGADVIVIDVRGSISYEREHIAGARSIPISEIPDRLDEIPRDKRLVLY